jgi:hypothetical protein
VTLPGPTPRAGVGNWIDRHWAVVTIAIVGGGVAASYSIVVSFSKNPALVGKLDVTTRGLLYVSLATSAGALLGLTIASIAILTTLDPARQRVHDMQLLPAWRILHTTFLVAALFLAITLAISTVALGVDSAERPFQTLEIAVVTISSVAYAELVVAGLAFAVVVIQVTRV